jgi:hypothetical protein
MMDYEYKVHAFLPTVKGCGAQDQGWNSERCNQFQAFLNQHAGEGWRLHSQEYRQVSMAGCSGGQGSQLICVFERSLR